MSSMPYQAESKKVATQHVSSTPEALHAHFLEILPRIETHAKISFRHLRCPGKREDAVQETIAIAWKWFLNILEQGKDVNEFVATLAAYAVRHVRCGRKVWGQERAKDVLSPRAQREKNFQVESLPSSTRRSHESIHGDPHGQDSLDALEERLRDNTQSPVPDQAAFRIDYPEWICQLDARKGAIAEDMALEHTTLYLADKHKVSPGRISQMRREFHADYQRFHGEMG